MSAKTAKSYFERVTKYNDKPINITVILTVTILTLIVALAWRDFADTAFKQAFVDDPEDAPRVLFWYALIMTIITVILIMIFAKYLRD